MAEIEGKLADAGYQHRADERRRTRALGDRHHVSERADDSCSIGTWRAMSNFKRRSSLRNALEERFPCAVHGRRKRQESETIASREELLEKVMAMAKKDLTIQRYKGLGEMNPEQLWETTMDPEKRTLLQVRIEDAIETDEYLHRSDGRPGRAAAQVYRGQRARCEKSGRLR